MSKSIENAVEIIERFGGIRPMSAKINVAVTTIQGWKKRGVIPIKRKEIILKAALEYNIDLSDFFDDVPENLENKVDVDFVNPLDKKADVEVSKGDSFDSCNKEKLDKLAADSEEIKGDTIKSVATSNDLSKEDVKSKDEFKPIISSSFDGDHYNIGAKYTEMAIDKERELIAKGLKIAAILVFLIILASVFLVWSIFKKNDDKIALLERDISEIRHTQTSFKGLVPENWSEQLSDLKKQVEHAKNAVGSSVDGIRNISKDLIQADSLEERVVKLQSYVSEIAGESGIYSLLSRFGEMEKSSVGQNILDNAVMEISSALANIKSKDDKAINDVLSKVRSDSPDVNKAFGDIPQSELKAAAMLLALTQVRSALNRSEEAFDKDLALLMNMIDEDDVELRSALEKLSPHAKTGLLSPSGLQSEFRTLAGDVVAASLSGEDVSFSERAAARMNEILQIEKDGELITGTETQAKVKKADKMLQNGDLNGAVRYLKKSLNAKELKPLRPWLKEAEAVLTSYKVKKALEQAIELNIGSGYLGGSQLLNDSNISK